MAKKCKCGYHSGKIKVIFRDNKLEKLYKEMRMCACEQGIIRG